MKLLISDTRPCSYAMELRAITISRHRSAYSAAASSPDIFVLNLLENISGARD